jgi:hypothetical protein
LWGSGGIIVVVIVVDIRKYNIGVNIVIASNSAYCFIYSLLFERFYVPFLIDELA